SELPVDALESLRRAQPHAIDGLIGLGSGLTPLGDDVVCGWLATLVAASHHCADLVSGPLLETVDNRTTKLSATLLRRAVAGDVVAQFTDLIHALARAPHPSESSPQDVNAAVRALTAIGHTSGAGLTLGLSIALDHLATRSYCP